MGLILVGCYPKFENILQKRLSIWQWLWCFVFLFGLFRLFFLAFAFEWLGMFFVGLILAGCYSKYAEEKFEDLAVVGVVVHRGSEELCCCLTSWQ